MAQIEVRQHVGVQQKIVGVQIAERRRLNGSAQIERLFPERIRHVRHDHIADVFSAGTVQHQPQGALRIMLADQDDGAMKKRTAQFAAVEQQLAFQRFEVLCHVCYRKNDLHRLASLTIPIGWTGTSRPRYFDFRNNSCFSGEPATSMSTERSRISRQWTIALVFAKRTFPDSFALKGRSLIKARRRLPRPEIPISVSVSGTGVAACGGNGTSSNGVDRSGLNLTVLTRSRSFSERLPSRPDSIHSRIV